MIHRQLLNRLFIFLIIMLGSFPTISHAQTIKVAGYYFPPFVEQDSEGKYIGITLDLIDEMNKFQNDYQFQFVSTSPKRRFYSFDSYEFDLIMFEDMTWGWQDKNVVASQVILSGGEVYITKRTAEKTQQFFESFDDKTIAVILGYHYGFIDLDANEKKMKQRYNIQFSHSHERNINKVLAGRADISVVSVSYLNKYLQTHPEVKEQLLISDKLDQEYHHTFLLRENATLKIEQVNALLNKMQKAGVLSKVWRKYGIQ